MFDNLSQKEIKVIQKSMWDRKLKLFANAKNGQSKVMREYNQKLFNELDELYNKLFPQLLSE